MKIINDKVNYFDNCKDYSKRNYDQLELAYKSNFRGTLRRLKDPDLIALNLGALGDPIICLALRTLSQSADVVEKLL